MSKRQKSSRKHFDGVTLRDKDASRTASELDFSPLLIIKSSSYKKREWQPKTTCFHEDDTLEIKDLSQSPRSTRCSMFHFSPTNTPSPGNSPTLSHKQLSDDSSVSQESVSTTNRPTVSSNLSERKRYMVISEIISTETKYVDNLNIILSTFLSSLETVVSPRSLRQLIPAQLDQLVESHEELLSDLKHRLSSESEYYGYVGDIFSRLCSPSNIEFFNMYRVYMGEFKIAMKTLATCENESREFKEVLNVLQQGPLCERLSLASYLLTPVQRLPRYELLLKELLKHTPVEHPDHFYVGEALGRLHKELTKLNQSIKSCQMVCSANNRSGRVRFNQSSSNLSRKTTRRAKRTLSMLKRFVSTPNIDDYSSGDSSLAEDTLTMPRFQRRRNAVTISSVSMCTSEVDLTSSIDNSNNTAVSALQVLSDDSRAVSCSDLLLEFGEKKKNNFRVLTPLPSEACTPASMASCRNTSRVSSLPESNEFSLDCRTSLAYSSNSSLSSEDRGTPRCESLTPTEESFRALRGAIFSTPVLREDESVEDGDPVCRKDVTLKYNSARTTSETSIVVNKEEHTNLKEEERDVLPQDISTEEATDSGKKATWRTLMGRKLRLTKRSKPNENKYRKNNSCET